MHSKGNHKQDKKTTLRTGENTCKGNNRQRINLQNIQTAHGAQLKKKKPTYLRVTSAQEQGNWGIFTYQLPSVIC